MTTADFTRAYVVDLVSQDRLEFDFNPKIDSDEKSADYDSVKIPGTSHPQISYANGGERVLNLTVRLVRLEEGQPEDYVKKQVEWLQSLEYSIQASSYDQSRPPYIQFIYGSLYEFPAVMKKVTPTWGEQYNDTLLPEWADVKLIIEEVALKTIRLDAVRNGGQSNVRYL